MQLTRHGNLQSWNRFGTTDYKNGAQTKDGIMNKQQQRTSEKDVDENSIHWHHQPGVTNKIFNKKGTKLWDQQLRGDLIDFHHWTSNTSLISIDGHYTLTMIINRPSVEIFFHKRESEFRKRFQCSEKFFLYEKIIQKLVLSPDAKSLDCYSFFIWSTLS